MSVKQAILIVDRRQGLRDDLAAIFAIKFPDIHVDASPNAREAEEKLESAARRGLGYLAVVVELNLFSGLDEEDGARPDLLSAAMSGWAWGLPEAPRIFLYCDHPTHPEVVRLRLQAGTEMTTSGDVPRQVFLPGAEPGWDQHLLDELGRLIHPRRIAARLAALHPPATVGPDGNADLLWPPHRGANENALPLRDLLGDIEEHWRYLKPRLESQVRHYFDVKIFPNGVEVTSRR